MKRPEDIFILIGCEESQTVCMAFRALGFQAFSCDVIPCSGAHPEYHLQMDIFEAIAMRKWDAAIIHPPCTFLTVCANRSFLNNPERWKQRLDALLFVHALMNCDIPMWAIENPVGVISTHIRKADQYIQPYEHGHPGTKKTGLWLKGLPPLTASNVVQPLYRVAPSGKRWNPDHWSSPSTGNPLNAKKRSTTYQGIANAMANQWGNYILQQN